MLSLIMQLKLVKFYSLYYLLKKPKEMIYNKLDIFSSQNLNKIAIFLCVIYIRLKHFLYILEFEDNFVKHFDNIKTF